jgi:hypothetical protein
MDSNFAPYAAPENVVRVLDRVHKNGLRGKLDPAFLGQLGITENLVPRTLRALEFLGFTKEDEEGAATPLLEQYVVSGEEDGKALLAEALRKSYESIFRAVDPERDSRDKINTAFKVMRPQSQWNRMVTFFLGMCRAAGMNVLEPPKERPGKSETVKERKERKDRKPKTVVGTAHTTQAPQTTYSTGQVSRALDPALIGIIGKIADIDSSTELESWIDAFRATFYFVKKIPPPQK